MNIAELTASQLRQIFAIKKRIEALRSQLDSIRGGEGAGVEAPSFARRKFNVTTVSKRELVEALERAMEMRLAKAEAESKATTGNGRLSAAGKAATKGRPAKVNGDGNAPEPANEEDRRGSRGSGRETEVRETGRGLVEHLDEIGSQQGHAQLIQHLMSLGIHYSDDGAGRSGDHGVQVNIRDPFNPDTMPEWLKVSRDQFPALAEAVYSFADRHRNRVLRRHERTANINGLSNFIDGMAATSRVLFVYLRRGVLTQPQVIARIRDYINIFTGTIPEYRDEEATGYLARIYSSHQGNPEQLKKTFEKHNVPGHLGALLRVAQVVRGSADGSDASNAGSQLPMLGDQIRLFENRIGLGGASAARIARALEHYEMLTDQELALWTKGVAVKRGVEPGAELPLLNKTEPR